MCQLRRSRHRQAPTRPKPHLHQCPPSRLKHQCQQSRQPPSCQLLLPLPTPPLPLATLQSPSELQVVAQSAESLTLSWRIAEQQPHSYTLFVDGKEVAGGITGTSYAFTGLSADKSYRLEIQAVQAGNVSAKVSVVGNTLVQGRSGVGGFGNGGGGGSASVPTPPLAPVLAGFFPATGTTGVTLTLTGSGFDLTATNNLVSFGTTPAQVLTATATSLQVKVPAGLTAGTQQVTVSVNGQNSAAQPFTYKAPALAGTGFSIQGAGVGDTSGSSVASAGDFNGDGRADLIVSAPAAAPNGRTGAGASYVIYGSATPTSLDLNTLTAAQGFVIQGAAAGDTLGNSAESGGDINGDGRTDLIVGASGAGPNGRTGAGASYVIYGSATPANVDLSTLNPAQGFVIQGAAANDNSGASVTSAGDINGDGRTDLIIGAPGAGPNGRPSSGASYVLFGSALPTNVDLNTLNPAQGFVIQGAVASDLSGSNVASAGDVNGDGKADLIIGVPGADPNGRNFAGASYVLFGSATPTNVDLSLLTPTQGFVIEGAAANDNSGSSVASAGDVNGDGKADLIVGAFLADPNGRINAGASYVIYGSGTPANVDLSTLNPAQGFVIQGAVASDLSGSRVASAGDVNGDGRTDLIVGAPAATPNGRATAGASYLIYGSSTLTNIDLSLLPPAQGLVIQGAVASDRSGSSVASAGDINGDGRPDLIVGAPRAVSNGRNNAGISYVLLGTPLPFPASIDLGALIAPTP